MGEQENSRPGSSFFDRLKKLIPLALILAIFSGFWLAFNWWGDFRYSEARSEMQMLINDIARERDKAEISAESAKSSLNLLQMEKTTLEKENREFRDDNRDLRDSVSSLSVEIKQYKTRVVEVEERGAVEVFDNQFLITVRDFRTENVSPVDPINIGASFYYIGDKTELLAKTPNGNYEDHTGSYYLAAGKALALQHGNKWYCVRLLFVDSEAQKATFSQNILDREPSAKLQ